MNNQARATMDNIKNNNQTQMQLIMKTQLEVNQIGLIMINNHISMKVIVEGK